jgi:hypothetical protein
MNCPICGKPNEPHVYHCAHCGTPLPSEQAPGLGASEPAAPGEIPPKPFNWLIPAILGLILCCPPLGIVSVIFAAQVEVKYYAGDYAGAEQSANRAKLFFLLSVVFGVLCGGAWLVLSLAGALTS